MDEPIGSPSHLGVNPLTNFSFEMYAPASVSESGVAIVERVAVSMQGRELSITDVLAKFEDFLRACGYAGSLENKVIDLVEK
jgi:hypothetical protein